MSRIALRRVALPAALLTLALAPAAAHAAPSLPPMAPAKVCDLVASTTGADSAAGTAAAPLRTASALSSRLRSGQTGCLRAGLYPGDVDVRTPGVTLTSYPGERATVKGRLYVVAGSDGSTIADLNLDGVNAAALPSPTVNAKNISFLRNDVTNDHTEICFLVGSSWGRAVNTVIKNNRIHDCGRLPSSNQDHGIYVSEADGTQIIDNVIVDNADRGVQLYPDAQGTVVRGNIIQGNGEGIIFSGAGGKAAGHTTVSNNIISGSNLRTDVESWYPSGNAKGTGNIVTNNCIGKVDASSGGFSASGNVSATPSFLGAASGDFRVNAATSCATVLGASTAPAGLNWQTPMGTATATPGATTPVTGSTKPTTGSTKPTTGSTKPAPTAGSTTKPSGSSTKKPATKKTKAATSKRAHIASCRKGTKRARTTCAKAARAKARKAAVRKAARRRA